uniref:Uncharacterized protein n=1 Tax=Arundo donax TaxID=35708 RepID=A0A0A8ZCZ5_ARUDO
MSCNICAVCRDWLSWERAIGGGQVRPRHGHRRRAVPVLHLWRGEGDRREV